MTGARAQQHLVQAMESCKGFGSLVHEKGLPMRKLSCSVFLSPFFLLAIANSRTVTVV